MNDITTVAAERESLDLHVDLCAQRYTLLEKRLASLEVKVDSLNDTITQGQNSISTVIVSSAATVVAGLLGLIATLIIKF
jgi:hypothetical protein